MPFPRPPLPQDRRPPSGRWRAVLALGVIGLGAVLVLWRSLDTPGEAGGRPVATERAVVDPPTVDTRLLEQVRDATPAERLRIEPRPLEHLLDVATHLTPDVLTALGLAGDTPLAALVREPGRWRGRPVAVRGTLTRLQPLPEPHPQPGRSVWSGQIRTGDGHTVLFKVVEPPDDAAPDASVLLTGLFLKLHDSQAPIALEAAPLVIGPTLVPTWPDWQPVTTLDPSVLARARDEDLAEQQRVQRLPLYHLTDWVRRAATGGGATRPLGQSEWVRLMEGGADLPRGTGFAIQGRVARIEEFTAEDNPLGVRRWSRAWLWQPELHATLCVLLPHGLPVHHLGDPVTTTGWFLKRIAHEPRPGGALATTCLFVADDLTGALAAGGSWVRYTALALLIVVSLLMTFLLLSPGNARRRAADSLVEHLTRKSEETQ